MQPPKMMAIKVGRHTEDVCLAINPDLFTRPRASVTQMYGSYLIINMLQMIYEDGYRGLGFTNQVVDGEFFKENFKFTNKNNDGGEKGFERVRRVYPPEQPMKFYQPRSFVRK